jgi:hypothetical protein
MAVRPGSRLANQDDVDGRRTTVVAPRLVVRVGGIQQPRSGDICQPRVFNPRSRLQNRVLQAAERRQVRSEFLANPATDEGDVRLLSRVMTTNCGGTEEDVARRNI